MAKKKTARTPKKATRKPARKPPRAKPVKRGTYPPYTLIFEGMDESDRKVCEGPHTESLRIGTPELGVKVAVVNNETAGGPILTIKISRE